MNSITILGKVTQLIQARGLTENKVCEMADLSHNTFYNWRKRGTFPTMDSLLEICDVLDVSIVQLFADEIIDDLTQEQRLLILKWSTLNGKNKKLVIEFIDALNRSGT